MKDISLPPSFPSKDTMLGVLKKTMEQSWKVDLDIEDIEDWLTNFTGKYFAVDIERQLALWLLCNFTYYNEDEVNHMCQVVYKNLVHRLMIDNNLFTDVQAEEQIRHTAFTSIGRASESGGLLLYHFRQESKLDVDRFIFPTDMIETDCDTIVCIDDAMMSGGTAQKFFYQHQDVLTKKKVYYISLITTETAISKLESLGINVIYCAKLDERSQLFSAKSLAFYKFQEVLPYAKELANEYGKLIEPQKPLGHRSGEYCFGLFYNIPNNSLPIFWSDKKWLETYPSKKGEISKCETSKTTIQSLHIRIRLMIITLMYSHLICLCNIGVHHLVLEP